MEGENMDTTAVDSLGPNAAPENSSRQQPSPVRSTDKYSVARDAKKKKRRAQHRAMIRRSHANG